MVSLPTEKGSKEGVCALSADIFQIFGVRKVRVYCILALFQ